MKSDDKAIQERAKFLRELLQEFGSRLSGFDPGVSALLPGKGRGGGWAGEQLSFDSLEWGWLEPLLIELRNRRYKKDLDAGSRATGRGVEKATTGSRKPSGNEAGRKPPRSRDETLENLLKNIRAYGYTVACHNDYRLQGMPYTFWLFTHPDGTWVKGEAPTDVLAVEQVMEEIWRAKR